jgi:aminopeptidase-like protein
MKSYSSLKSILAEFFPLHRTLASDDQDKTLEIVGSYMPASSNYTVETYAPLTPVWTWKVPERYVVHEAYLEIEARAEQGRSGGERIVDFKDNPLHIVSYSLPVDAVLTWEELQPHLYFNEKRPNAVPWIFKYYERDWGFCLSKKAFDGLPHDRRYHAVIRSEFIVDPKQGFKVASALVHPQGGPNPNAGEMIIQAHTCHPMQANDDGAGVVSAIELARRLVEKPLPAGSMSIRFWFGPETIGTIAYLAHNESLIPNLRGGIFLEMTGNQNKIAWHHTRQHDHLLDRIANYQLRSIEHDERDFAAAPANDERVINGPGVNAPCISLNRWPYEEYHTTDDNLDILHEDMLLGAADIAEQIVRIYASNYIPKRTFRGPVFLSGNGLWVDWRDNWDLNRAIEKIMMRFEGRHSVFDIAEQVGLDYWMVREYVERFRAKGFIVPLPIPSVAETS